MLTLHSSGRGTPRRRPTRMRGAARPGAGMARPGADRDGSSSPPRRRPRTGAGRPSAARTGVGPIVAPQSHQGGESPRWLNRVLCRRRPSPCPPSSERPSRRFGGPLGDLLDVSRYLVPLPAGAQPIVAGRRARRFLLTTLHHLCRALRDAPSSAASVPPPRPNPVPFPHDPPCRLTLRAGRRLTWVSARYRERGGWSPKAPPVDTACAGNSGAVAGSARP